MSENKGFYRRLQELRKEDIFADFSFLSGIKATRQLNAYTAYDFLHGFCVTFAYMLSMEKGYPVIMREIVGNDEEGRVVHAWCEKNGSYIDIRGMTSNFGEFWEEFEDFDSFDLEDEHFCLHGFSNHEELYEYLNGDTEYQSFSPYLIQMAKNLYRDYQPYYQM